MGFGELALLFDGKRSATIKAHEDCHMATISSMDFRKILGDKEKEKLLQQTRFLMQLPFFKKLNYKQIQYLHFNSTHQYYKMDEVVYLEDEATDYVYIIVEGMFSVHKNVMCDKLPEAIENEPPLFKQA